MPIVSFNFEKISVEKKAPAATTKITIKNNATIIDVVEETLPLKSAKDGIIKCSFEFTTLYEPKVGEINLRGNVLYLDTHQKIQELIKKWKKEKKLGDDIQTAILNIILSKCNIRALSLAEEINLPPQIPLPKLSPNKEKDYIG